MVAFLELPATDGVHVCRETGVSWQLHIIKNIKINVKNWHASSCIIMLFYHMQSSYSDIAPDIFTVSLESVNGTMLPNFTSPTILTANTVIFDIKDVPYGDLWYCRIYASRCSNSILVSEITSLSEYNYNVRPISLYHNTLRLRPKHNHNNIMIPIDHWTSINSIGTFDFQDVKFSNNQNGVLVLCDFIEGSEAAGILIIAYSVTDSSNIHYGVIPRKDQDSVVGGLACLPEGEYNVLLFVIRDNGIPHTTPAQFPSRRRVSANTSLSESADQVRCTWIAWIHCMGKGIIV